MRSITTKLWVPRHARGKKKIFLRGENSVSELRSKVN